MSFSVGVRAFCTGIELTQNMKHPVLSFTCDISTPCKTNSTGEQVLSLAFNGLISSLLHKNLLTQHVCHSAFLELDSRRFALPFHPRKARELTRCKQTVLQNSEHD